MSQANSYPVQIKGDLSAPPGRGWWLLKWLLLIPHFIVLFFLLIAYIVVSIIAFFAILFTARYPRGLFDFNVGVMRWVWRVSFYGYSVLGTDKYPPFSFQPAADYPADLEVPYPDKLSRGLVLVKWWLLAIPHYLVVAAFSGGALFTYNAANGRGWKIDSGIGLISALVIIAAVYLLFSGKFHQDIFRLLVGLNRWNIRVMAYSSLMRDEYPPFRLWD